MRSAGTETTSRISVSRGPLQIDLADLDRRFRELSRKFHPDYYYNAPPAERLASLERSSYLNDAVRTLRNPASRIEHLLAIEGLPPAKSEEGHRQGSSRRCSRRCSPSTRSWTRFASCANRARMPSRCAARLDGARRPIDDKREEHERQLQDLSARWDAQHDAASPQEKRATLEALRERLLERNYINNLLATIEREVATTGVGTRNPGATQDSERPTAKAPSHG